ncbi:MAG TPA: LPS export ABC transporter periplasmic protein LptC [Burkholderiales bacterium]
MLDARKLILGFVLIVVASASWWLTHQVAEPPPAASTRPRHEPDYIVENFAGNAMNAQGARQYRLTAKRLTHYPDDDTTHFVEPLLVQFRPGGSTATTRADKGVMPGSGTEIVMTGNVHVTRSADGRSSGGEITTDQLRVELDR